VSDKKSFQTLLTTTDYHPPEGFAAFTTPIHHASTVLFRDVAALRSRDWQEKAPIPTACTVRQPRLPSKHA
jgi:cystathionine beta-lyase